MYPANFDYARAESVEQAIDLLQRHPGAKLLAGGHSLIPMLKLRLAAPELLVDIGRITELTGVSEENGSIRIGALTTHADIAASEVLADRCPLLSEAASKIGDPQVRNRGTIGGNIAHADPASDLPAPLLVLDASVHLTGIDGERVVPIAEFFTGLLQTDLGPSELMTHLTLPQPAGGSGSCYLKMEHPASGYAVCGAAALVSSPDRVGLALNGVAATPVRMRSVEERLAASDWSDDAIDDAVDAGLEVTEPLADSFVSADFRRHLARVWSQRALRCARDRADL